MGKLIDADVLREEVNSWGMNDYEPSDFTDAIDDAPTVEAIPKADYENRLKADMAAMLEEIDARLTKLQTMCNQDDLKDKKMHFAFGVSRDVIQEKINALKGE